MYNEKLEKIVKKDLMLSLFGVAPLDKLQSYMHEEISEASKKLDSVIVIGLEVSSSLTQTLHDKPNLIYKHHYSQLNYLLDRSALQITEVIMNWGFNAIPIPASQVVDFEKQLGHFCHRHAAVEAGIGWIGKNNLLITHEFGAHQRLATILTDLPLQQGKALENTGCGLCNKCVNACPAHALDSGYSYEKCIDQLNQFRSIRGIGHHICGLCIAPCFGKRGSGFLKEK